MNRKQPSQSLRRHSVQPFRLSRRTFLAGASSTIWLPALEAMFNANGTALAAGEPIAKRFIEFFWGVSYTTVGGDRTWAPRSGSGPLPATLPYYFNTDEKYQAKLRGLAQSGTYGLRPDHLTPSLSDPDIRRYIRIIDGISTSRVVFQSNQHYQALLGSVCLPENFKVFGSSLQTGPSMDRFIGSFGRFRAATAPHMNLGVVPVSNYGGVSLSAREHRVSIDWSSMKEGVIGSGGKEIRPQAQFDPALVFQEMFGNRKPSASMGTETTRQRSVLDGVLKASTPTLSRLSATDKQKVEAHLETIRQVEKNLNSSMGCSVPTPPQSARVQEADLPAQYRQQTSNQTAPRVAKDMRDLIALMIQCDYTRCITFMVTPALGGFDGKYFLDFSSATGSRAVGSLHRDSHDAKPYHRLTTPWHMGQLAALIKQISQLGEGAGSALDNTLIWATSEHGPQVHSLDNIATIVVGGPKLVGGNHFLSPGTRTMSDMHLGLLQALELPTKGYLDFVKPPNPNPIALL